MLCQKANHSSVLKGILSVRNSLPPPPHNRMGLDVRKPSSNVTKYFSYSIQLSMEFILNANNFGILTVISKINTQSECMKQE